MTRLYSPALALAIVAVVAGCGAGTTRRFPLRQVMWTDDDRRPFAPQPRTTFNPYIWDAVDHTVFRQASELFTYELDREALNVNAVDEVADSSWFTNRIGRHPMTADELALGPCASLAQPPFPWRVVRGKSDGSSPGAVIEAADGRRYVFKVDFRQPERATAADVIATRILHAVGYFVPCNQVVFFEPGDVVIDSSATMRGAPYGPEQLAALVAASGRAPDGRRRASLSLFVEGVPLGGWRFEGRRGDDPNDVVDHQHRRETRGMYVASSWLNHVDSRAENNMSVWMESGGGQGHVRHYVLDAGDTFGISWHEDALVRRLGHSHYLDLQHALEDFVTLGIAERPWTNPARREGFEVFAYYPNVEDYVPDQWRNGYPNPAFERRTERDMAWMARIISRFDRQDLAAIVELGRWSDPRHGAILVGTLWGRRARLLERWLTRVSPLSDVEVRGAELCATDLAVRSGIRDARARNYRARAYAPGGRLPLAEGWSVAGSEICVPLPRQSPGSASVYLVVDVQASTVGHEPPAPLRAHLYEHPPGSVPAFTLVGVERPSTDAPPRL